MLDFEREEQRLREATGLDSSQILALASAPSESFARTRERMSQLAARPRPTQAEVLERDRLASFFGCAYGPSGLLSRAGTLQTLGARWERLAALLPHLAAEPKALHRVRREALILRSFALARFGRARAETSDARVREASAVAALACGALADFADGAAAIERQNGGAGALQALWAAADLVEITSDARPERPLWRAVAFLLARAGDRLAHKTSGNASYEALVEQSLGALRNELWEANAAAWARSADPAPLAAIEAADVELETLLAQLREGRAKGALRALLVAALWTAAATARCAGAAHEARAEQAGTLQVLVEGLEAEERQR